MRWVVYVLLAGNLGLLGWNLYSREAPAAQGDAPVAIDPAEADALPLIAELGEGALRSRPGSEPPAAPKSNQTVAAAPQSAAPAPPQTEPAAPTPISVGEPEPEKEEPETLLAQRAPAKPPTPPSCFTIGPIETESAIPDIKAWLEERGANVDVHANERREVALYWIYLPPRASRQAASEEVAAMKEQGIDDIIVVPKGDMANAISLGVFSRIDSRDRRLAELNRKGFDPTVGPRYRTKLASWIDVSAPQDAVAPADLVRQWSKARITPTTCPGQPSDGKNRYHFSDQPKKL